MDALRARAYLDILLGMDSRPLGSRADGGRQPQDPNRPEDPAQPQPQAPAPGPGPGGPPAGMIPPGFAGQVTLTIPEATVTGARRTGPASWAGSGPSTRTWPATWLLPRPATPGRPGASPSPTRTGTRSGTAAPGLPERRKPGRARSAGQSRVHLHSRRVSPARPAGTAPGGSPPGSRTC